MTRLRDHARGTMYAQVIPGGRKSDTASDFSNAFNPASFKI
jgi:hypothetical protein